MSGLQLYLFGQPRLEQNGESIRLRGRKVLALAAYLVVTKQHHSRDALAALLWPDFDPAGAKANLRRELSRLNKVLGDGQLAIERDSIRLSPESTLWLDVAQFQDHLAACQTHGHPASDICADCLSPLSEAAELYTADFLSGFTLSDSPEFDEWQFFQAEGLRQQLASVLERLAAGYSVQGDFEVAIPYARRWLSLDPLHEPAHQQLMQLYAWSGQQAAALRQYQECERILEEELGVPPSEETTALYEAIKAKRLSLPTEAEEQGSRGAGEKSSPLPLSPSAPQHNLPPQSTPLFGRKAELASLDEFLTNPDVRLVTIVGPGGMGKTRLSLAAGTAVSSHFPDGIFFIPLAPVQTADKIVLALAEQLGYLFHGDTSPEDQILEYLQPRRFLFIFDNFEHVIAGAQFVAAILQHAPDITMLVTSRERLNIAGEAVFRLGGLSYPDSESTDPVAPGQTEVEYGALELFLYHAKLVRPDLDFDQNTLVHVTRICKLVQGMPLAIILAVSWIETLALDELAEAIAGSVDILASEQRDLPPRQRSIRAAFEASWQRLAPVDQAIYAKLSVFRGGFNRKAAEVVAEATLFTLRSLIEKSLIVPAGPDRYELHELLRQFAAEKLAETGNVEDVKQAHGRHYLGELNALEADLKGQRQIEAFKEVEANFSNIQAAWIWVLENTKFSLIDAALESLTLFCYYSTRANEGHALYQGTRESLISSQNERLLGRFLACYAWIRSEYGLETDTIEADLTQSLTIAEKFGDQRGIAFTKLARGYYLTRIFGDHSTALVQFEQAFQIYQALDDQFYMTILLRRIGYCQIEVSPTKFIDFTRQSLELALEIGNEYEAVGAQSNLGSLAMAVGNSLSGERDLRHALAREEKIGLSNDGSHTSNLIALAGFLRGDLEQTSRYLLPQTQLVTGKLSPNTIAYASATRALYAVLNGELESAEQLARYSLDFSGNFEAVLLAHWALAMIYLDKDQWAEAGQHLATIYRRDELTHFPGMMTRSLPVAAMVLARQGQPERAAQVLSLAQNHPASQTGWLHHWSSGAPLRSEVEQTLGTAAFQVAWEHGRSLDLAEMIGLLAHELSGEEEEQPSPLPPTPPHNLPPQPTSFIGREAELAALDDLIANPDVRLVTIVGSGGMGKTRLSIQAVTESLESFPDGVYFVPLAPISSAEFLISAITDALNLTVYGATDPKTQLLNYLREKATLLVLDNFEHLLVVPTEEGAGVTLLSEIVLAAPRVQLLVTSRERLNLQEEWVFELQGMAFPAATDSAPPGESKYSALQLFEQRARQVQPEFDLTTEYAEVIRICQLVNGIPLGLELAVTWLKLMSCREIADEIEQNLDFLATSIRNVPERHRSLRAVFEHSWQLLSEDERDVFKKLSVFRGGFLREAAKEVAGASLPLLSTLVDKSLLRRTETGRYEVHELLRQYAAEKLETTPQESEAVQTAHAHYYADFLHVREADLRGSRQKEALGEIAAELDNVRVSWGWAVEQADVDLIGESLESLHDFSEMRGRARDGVAAFRQAVARFTELGIGQGEAELDEHKIILGNLMSRYGGLGSRIGAHQQGLALKEQGILMLRQVEYGAGAHLAAALNKFALFVYFVKGEHDKAKQLVQEALALATSTGYKIEVAYAYNVMGHLAEFQGEYKEAGPLFAESIRHYQAIGEQRSCTFAQNNWGRAAYAMGEYEQAEELIQAALAVRREFGDLVGISYSLLDLGKLAKMQGEYTKASNYVREALGYVEEMGDRDLMARCYHGLGMVAEGQGDFEQAEEFHQKSLTIYHEIGVKRALPLTLNHLSWAAYERGEYQLAQQRLQDCLAACDELENRGERASAMRHLGHVAVALGNYLETRQYFREALAILAETGARPVALDVLVGWATLLMKHEPTDTDRAQAVELLSLVEHHPASEYETKEKAKRLLAEWGRNLPPEALTSAQTRGRELDLWETAAALSRELTELGLGGEAPDQAKKG